MLSIRHFANYSWEQKVSLSQRKGFSIFEVTLNLKKQTRVSQVGAVAAPGARHAGPLECFLSQQ